MITYENLLQNALSVLPEFKHEYEDLIERNIIDKESGNHILFSYIFVPIALETLKQGNEEMKQRYFNFLENMAASKDVRVTEVCDFTVLEELYWQADKNDLWNALGHYSRKGLMTVSTYME